MLILWMLAAGPAPGFAGDSLYGKVTEVKSADRVTFDYGDGKYELRLVGIEAQREGPIAREATQLVSKLVLGKSVRMRFEGRSANDEMLARLFTDDPDLGIREVANTLHAALTIEGAPGAGTTGRVVVPSAAGGNGAHS